MKKSTGFVVRVIIMVALALITMVIGALLGWDVERVRNAIWFIAGAAGAMVANWYAFNA